MTDDPCFRCVLPECDDSNGRCAVRRLYRSYTNKISRGEKAAITEAEREANNRIFDSYRLERLALASEGVRPYRRSGSPWRGDEGASA